MATTTTKTATRRAPLPTPLVTNTDPAHLDALWAMTHNERVEAMWAGRLTGTQLTAWTQRRPDQVPKLGGEFAWLVMYTPEWQGDDEQPADDQTNVDNVVPFPVRSDQRAAA